MIIVHGIFVTDFFLDEFARMADIIVSCIVLTLETWLIFVCWKTHVRIHDVFKMGGSVTKSDLVQAGFCPLSGCCVITNTA